MSSIHPKGRRVLVKPDEVESTVKMQLGDGQFVEFELAQDRKLERSAVMKGTVEEVGHLAWKDFSDETPWCQPGDRVMWAPFSGQRIKDPVTDEYYVIMNDEDILGTLDK